MRLEVNEPSPRYAADLAAAAQRGDLPDVNVWLALAVIEHPHHAAAADYWQRGAAPQLWFNRVTMLALVRLLCQPKVMGPAAALELTRAIDVYRGFAALPEVGLQREPDACDAELQRLAAPAHPPLPARLWTDAYLAAFAITAGLRLVTFDRDFDRFAGLHVLRLNTFA